MATLSSEFTKPVLAVWKRFEALGYSDPWYDTRFGLYAYEPGAHRDDDRVCLCKADGRTVWHVGNPCILCGEKHDYISLRCKGVDA